LRIAISPSLKKKEDLSLFDGTSLTWVLTENPGEESDTVKYFSPQNGEDYLTLLLRLCRENQILSVFVEGGATTLNSFLERKLWDEIRVFRSRTVFFSSGIAAPKFSPSQVNVIESKEIEEDILDLIYSEHIQLKS
jgi:diaminohydroxyphosphoribosylaminopyrimidine deaminase / 5-amino-6-(5-phosphoribosylamino)uracil reductase